MHCELDCKALFQPAISRNQAGMFLHCSEPGTHLATRLMAAPKLGASLAFVATLSSLMAVPGLVSSSELVSLTN